MMYGWLAVAGSLLLHNFRMPECTRVGVPPDWLIGFVC